MDWIGQEYCAVGIDVFVAFQEINVYHSNTGLYIMDIVIYFSDVTKAHYMKYVDLPEF
jgi:hypothetical protein